jgi:uncharacterized protein YbaR (Trm112 family)
MAVAKELLDILVCPESREPLLYFPAAEGRDEFLLCPGSRLKYRVDDGIPVMLIEEAERLDAAEVARLVAAAAR